MDNFANNISIRQKEIKNNSSQDKHYKSDDLDLVLLDKSSERKMSPIEIIAVYLKDPKLIWTNWFQHSELDQQNLFNGLSELTGTDLGDSASRIKAISKYFAGLVLGKNGDVNMDGKVDADDVIMVWKDAR